MEETLDSASLFAFTSHDTALCLIPPQDQWPSVDRLRSLYDKAYNSWPPHINLIYPFVHPEVLPKATKALQELDLSAINGATVNLEAADTFLSRKRNTLFLRPTHGPNEAPLLELKNILHNALGQPIEGEFRPHLTVGQSEDHSAAPHKFLLGKLSLLAPLSWPLGQVAILTRHVEPADGQGDRRMRLWGVLDVATSQFTQPQANENPYNLLAGSKVPQERCSPSKISPQTSYHFSESSDSWQVATTHEYLGAQTLPERIVVASYNVLAEFEWPPRSSRHPGLVENLLSSRASADILVLQEVTDHFLPFLLANKEIRARYPYATHGPPDQPGVGPLPSLLNVAVLSKYPLKWEHLPFQRKHKGCAVVTFPTIGTSSAEGDQQLLPLVLVACHLSQGLVDGAVVAKKHEMSRILEHLTSNYSGNPWILAGDFNLATSSFTIDAARKRQDISAQTVQYLRNIDSQLLHAGFQDTWLATRLESGESSGNANEQQNMVDAFEGEQGATFDPRSNSLAAELIGSGMNNRPQRYDRILVKGNGQLRSQGFNMFGREPMQTSGSDQPEFASDHWGIRCLLVASNVETPGKLLKAITPIRLRRAPEALQPLESLKTCLENQGCFPSQAERLDREDALRTLECALLDTQSSGVSKDERVSLALTLVPVGSYGLGVWTGVSDIDCLCIGSISSKTFFALALQRLRRAGSEGVSVLRRVKANSGYMLELDVRGIKVDLQYCTATSIAEKWPEVMNRPSNDPAFALPMQTLAKLKPVRDLFYLRRSIPDMTQYRMSHLLIKTWAKSRGLYSAKFGLLGGIHISVLLVPICKTLAATGEPVSTSDIIMSFFDHYANFDWKTELVFDPFFHKELRYHRTFREALCLLGWHAPSLNTAANASVPTVKTIAAEFVRAKSLLSDCSETWDDFLNPTAETQPHPVDGHAATEFLAAYRSYIKIDAHYWGSSPEKGNRFIGWLESRCVMLLVDIDRKLAGIMARIWPARFSDNTSTETNNAGTEYHGSYLVGLEWDDSSPADSSKEKAKRASETLQNILKDFEARIHGDERYYDAKSSWMTTSVVKTSDLHDLTLDKSQWGGPVADEDDCDSDDDLDFEEDELDELDGTTQHEDGQDSSNKKSSVPIHASRASTGVKPAGLGKFRTAADVLNRLRWDSNLNTSDYIVGYEDRFTGARERPVEQWKSEQTDEEFIPQHRILYFKRKTDGAILWERRSRIDELFGSGIMVDSSRGSDTP